MKAGTTLTVRVEQGLLSDGSEVFTASLESMPGVVAEGESEDAAISELLAMVEDLFDRLDSDVVAVLIDGVGDWEWTIQHEDQAARAYGSKQWETVPENEATQVA